MISFRACWHDDLFVPVGAMVYSVPVGPMIVFRACWRDDLFVPVGTMIHSVPSGTMISFRAGWHDDLFRACWYDDRISCLLTR